MKDMGGVLALVFALVLAADSAFAKPLLGVGAGLLLEQEGRQKRFEVQAPLLARAGWEWPKIDGFLEYQTFMVDSGEGFVSVRRRLHSWLGMARYRFSPNNGWIVPTTSLGVGAIYESVRTRVANDSVEADGKARVALVGATGVMALLNPMFNVSFDIRFIASDGLRPNPTLGATLSLGASF